VDQGHKISAEDLATETRFDQSEEIAMPADLVPHAAIPDLAARVSPEMLEVLRRIQKAEFIMNGEGVDAKTAEALGRLSELGLVDPGYAGDEQGSPYMWVSNANGSRVLSYRTGIRGGPHYEVPAVELAAWLENQGKDRWWNVDGDPLLTGRLTFPCPAAHLAAELKKINRPLLVQARKGDAGARGQTIDAAKLGDAVGRFAENDHTTGQASPWANDRILYLCWRGSLPEWLLEEDSEATAQMQIEERARAWVHAQRTKE
jgi:hypothetical protein